MSKIIDILYALSKLGMSIASIFNKIKSDKRKKEDEKEQADLENILHPIDKHND